MKGFILSRKNKLRLLGDQELLFCFFESAWMKWSRGEVFLYRWVANTALSFKTTSIILVILRKTIVFAHSDAGSTASGVSFYRSYKIIFVGDAGSTASGVSFYRSYKIIFVGGNQMRQRSFFDFRLNFRYAKIRFILLTCNILHV